MLIRNEFTPRCRIRRPLRLRCGNALSTITLCQSDTANTLEDASVPPFQFERDTWSRSQGGGISCIYSSSADDATLSFSSSPSIPDLRTQAPSSQPLPTRLHLVSQYLLPSAPAPIVSKIQTRVSKLAYTVPEVDTWTCSWKTIEFMLAMS